ncbi:MAG: hypothetical protein WAN47_05705 [Nitrosotalea sp.]
MSRLVRKGSRGSEWYVSRRNYMKIKLAVGVVVALMMIPVIAQHSYADGDVVAKDCTAVNLQYNEFLYKEDINGINQAASLYVEAYPHYSMGKLAGYMDNVYLNQPVELAQCLNELAINPASVAQLSPLAYGALVYDKAQLQGYSPNFLKEIPTPQVDTIQNVVQHQALPVQKEIVQDQRQSSPAEPNPVQAAVKPVQDTSVAIQENQQQIPAEYVSVAVVAAVALGIAIVFFDKIAKDLVLLGHHRAF